MVRQLSLSSKERAASSFGKTCTTRTASMIEPSLRQTYETVLKALDQFDESPEQYLEYLND